jgi:acyl dehydratase
MAIDLEKLMQWRSEDRFSYTFKDTILYALGVGCGADPIDAKELRFVYEDGLKALPTMAIALGYADRWLMDPQTGIDWRKVLHAEQTIRLHREIPAAGTVIGRTRVVDVLDKGPGKGALVFSERDVVDEQGGALLATLHATIFVRGHGGFGGRNGATPPPHAIPDRLPDTRLDLPTLPQAALIYRLSGDFNPLHVDPRVAREQGFGRPILHGMCTYGVAGRAILRAQCDGDPGRLASIGARFSAPVFPGETIRTEMWRSGMNVSFRAIAVERGAIVLDNGLAELRA